jgi:hypothetical protein
MNMLLGYERSLTGERQAFASWGCACAALFVCVMMLLG